MTMLMMETKVKWYWKGSENKKMLNDGKRKWKENKNKNLNTV